MLANWKHVDFRLYEEFKIYNRWYTVIRQRCIQLNYQSVTNEQPAGRCAKIVHQTRVDLWPPLWPVQVEETLTWSRPTDSKDVELLTENVGLIHY